MKRSPHPDDVRVDEALAAGITLRFTGRHFEDAAHGRGIGPTWPMAAVLRRARAGKAMITTTAGEGVYFEVLARAAPRRNFGL